MHHMFVENICRCEGVMKGDAQTEALCNGVKLELNVAILLNLGARSDTVD